MVGATGHAGVMRRWLFRVEAMAVAALMALSWTVWLLGIVHV